MVNALDSHKAIKCQLLEVGANADIVVCRLDIKRQAEVGRVCVRGRHHRRRPLEREAGASGEGKVGCQPEVPRQPLIDRLSASGIAREHWELPDSRGRSNGAGAVRTWPYALETRPGGDAWADHGRRASEA